MSELVCNGLATNCNLAVNEIMFAGVHNAMSSQADGFLGPTNLRSLEDALEAGFRALNIDSCNCTQDGFGIALCHDFCLVNVPDFGDVDIGQRSVKDVFENVTSFMLENPSEVVIIDLQANADTLSNVYSTAVGVEGFFDLLYYHPNPDDPWPLMRTLVESNKRLLFFTHRDDACNQGNCPEGVMATFAHCFDTPFGLREPEQLLDFSQSCVLNRGKCGSMAFFISNHYALALNYIINEFIASQEVAQVVNQRQALEDRSAACAQEFSKDINVLFVDFWSIGDVLSFVNAHNRALGERFTSSPSPPGTTVIPSGAPSNSSNGSGSATSAPPGTTVIPSSAPSNSPDGSGSATSAPPSMTSSPASAPSDSPEGSGSASPLPSSMTLLPSFFPSVSSQSFGGETAAPSTSPTMIVILKFRYLISVAS